MNNLGKIILAGLVGLGLSSCSQYAVDDYRTLMESGKCSRESGVKEREVSNVINEMIKDNLHEYIGNDAFKFLGDYNKDGKFIPPSKERLDDEYRCAKTFVKKYSQGKYFVVKQENDGKFILIIKKNPE
jgi:hypothetical protein